MGRLRQLLRRSVPRLMLGVALLACGLASHQLWLAWQAHGVNQMMRDGETPANAPAMVYFAQAVKLEAQDDLDNALRAYAEAEARGDDAMVLSARVNAANLYLRRAIGAATSEGAAAQAITLIDLAKAGYRKVLHENPDYWAARYNLELAQVLVPDYEIRAWRQSGNEAQADESVDPRKAAWTEMVGAPRGLH